MRRHVLGAALTAVFTLGGMGVVGGIETAEAVTYPVPSPPVCTMSTSCGPRSPIKVKPWPRLPRLPILPGGPRRTIPIPKPPVKTR